MASFQGADAHGVSTISTICDKVLDELSNREGYILHGSSCYKPISNPKGQFTHAWERACELREFIDCSDFIDSLRFLELLPTSVNLTRASSMLTELVLERAKTRPHFRIQPNRHLVCYLNGFLHTENLFFYEHDKKREWGDGTVFAIGRMRQDDPHAASLLCCPTKADASFKLFERIFPEDLIARINNPATLSEIDAFSIPTPTLDHIFDCQRLALDTKKHVYAMLGRLLFDEGRFDNFKTGLLLGGRACTGKSTVANFITSFLCDEAVAALSFETTFEARAAWETLRHADLAVVWETREEKKFFVGKTKAEWKAALAGGWIRIDGMGRRPPLTFRIRSPFLLVGTDIPTTLRDNLLLIGFGFPIPAGEIKVDIRERLEAESPHALGKFVIAYRKLAIEAKGLEFWTQASPQLKVWRDEVMYETR